jgi:hypothetical protein
VEKSNPRLTICYVCFIDLTTRASGKTPAVGSLKIAEFDNGHRGVCRSFKMVSLANQVSH